MRLIELLAVSIHNIAATLFILEPKAHAKDHIDFVTKWEMPTGWDNSGDDPLERT